MAELIFPNATNWIDALEAGQKAGMTQRRTAALQQAGNLMTQGDYTGAANAVLPVDINAGVALQKYGAENSILQRQTAFRQALATHDLPTATQLAAGDPEMHQQLASYMVDTAKTLAEYAQPLKGLPLDQATQKYQTEVLPRLHQLGLSGPEYDNWQPTPDNINQVETTAIGLQAQFERHKPVAVGTNLVDPATGKAVYKGPDVKAVTKASGGQVLVDASQLGGGATDADAGGGGAAPAGPTTVPQTAPLPTGGIYGTVAQVAAKAGAQPNEVGYLQRLAQVESHGDPGAQNGRSTGLFQFHPDTFAAAGGQGDIHDVGQQTQAALNLSRHDRQKLQQLGVQPNDENAYIMHQQGPGGGPALLTAAPDTNAVAALTPVYGNTPKGQAMARAAIVNNGGTADMTAGDFVKMWHDRWNNGGAPVTTAPGAPQGGAASPGPKQPGVLFDSDTMDDEGTKLTDDTVKMAAGMYLKTGVMPALGMKSTAARSRILNAANDIAKDLHLDAGDIVSGMADVKAQGKALADNENRLNQVKGFEDTAIKNGDLALSLAPKGGAQGSVPVINRWIQAGRKKIAGDPDVASFDVALGTFADEYAKVVAGQNGSTDSVRNEAYSRINNAMTQDQLRSVLATMKQEMANRTGAMSDISEGIRTRLRTGGQATLVTAPTPAPAPAAAPAKVIRYDAQGHRLP